MLLIDEITFTVIYEFNLSSHVTFYFELIFYLTCLYDCPAEKI